MSIMSVLSVLNVHSLIELMLELFFEIFEANQHNSYVIGCLLIYREFQNSLYCSP